MENNRIFCSISAVGLCLLAGYIGGQHDKNRERKSREVVSQFYFADVPM